MDLKNRGSVANSGVGLGVDDRLDSLAGVCVNWTDVADSRQGNEDALVLLEPMYTVHTLTWSTLPHLVQYITDTTVFTRQL